MGHLHLLLDEMGLDKMGVDEMGINAKHDLGGDVTGQQMKISTANGHRVTPTDSVYITAATTHLGPRVY